MEEIYTTFPCVGFVGFEWEMVYNYISHINFHLWVLAIFPYDMMSIYIIAYIDFLLKLLPLCSYIKYTKAFEPCIIPISHEFLV